MPEEVNSTLTPTLEQTTPTPAVGQTTLGAATTPEAKTEPPVTLKAEDLTLPEGLAKESLNDFLAIANNHELAPKERTEALLGLYASKAKELAEGPFNAFKELNTQWQTEMKNDPEIGGEKLQKDVLPAVSKLIDQFGGDKFRQVLDLTGAGNNPEMARFLYKVAQAFTESSQHVSGNPPAASAPARPSPAAALYPGLIAKQGT